MSSDTENRRINHGFHFDTTRIRYLAYRLLATFFADVQFSTLRTGDFDSPPDKFRSEFVEADIERFLIEIAIYMRMIDDAAQDGRTWFGRSNPTVGTVTVSADGSPSDLSLRDACNKIIHSKKRTYRTTNRGDFDWNDQLKPFVELHGEYQQQQWRAEIDIQQFCFAVGRLPE